MDLDLSPDVASKTISDILKEASEIDDLSKKSLKLDLHVHALEEEMKKIEAFKRELPHCMHLLKDAIERLKEESRRGEGMEDFTLFRGVKASNEYVEKKNWMSSVQLCTPVSRNHDSVFHLRSRLLVGEGSGSGNPFGRNFRKDGGAFWPFKKPSMKEKQRAAPVDELTLAVPEAYVAPNDLTKNGDFGFGGAKPQQLHEQEQQKKQRRCWSPELHKIFVDALRQLGGAQTATPKQIRELMKVEGLTNDEVKSHLQKYRIHVKRVVEPVSSIGPSQFAVSNSGSPQGPLPGKAANGVSTANNKPESHGWKSKIQQPL